MDSLYVTVDLVTSTAVQVPCLYCRAGIDATSFVSWSSTERLLSATCPSCDRRVSITKPTWQRWSVDPTLEGDQ